MKKKIRFIASLLSLSLLLLAGCSGQVEGSTLSSETQSGTSSSNNTTSDTTGEDKSASQSIKEDNSVSDTTEKDGLVSEVTEENSSALQKSVDVSDMFTDRDYETSYEETANAVITLNGNSAECSSNAVKISGVVVTITDGGTYVLSGTLDNGMIIVNAEKTDKIQLVLDGVTINSDTSAAIYVAQADKVFLTQTPDSKNSLSNGGTFTAIDDNNIDAVIFSKDDLTINGTGTLTINSPAGHGVVSKDDLVVTGGEYIITSAKHGLCGKDSVRIADGIFSLTAGKDGIHAENTDDTSLGFVYLANGVYTITADGDGISASNLAQIDDGSFTIQTGGGSETVTLDSEGSWNWQRPEELPGRMSGEMPDKTPEETTVSAKGIKAGGNLLLNGGDFVIDSADDALHSNANLTLNGGNWKLSTGDDGLHADETATVTDGTITITKSYEGIEGQNILISGGTIDLVASDDGLNAAGGNDQSGNGGFGGFQKGGFDAASDNTLTISGGIIHINASGDGVDSNGALIVTGGETYVSGPSDSGNGALDYNGEASISGGIFIAAGSFGMAQNFSTSSTQGAMLVNLSGSENDTITLKDGSGKEILHWTADKSFDCVLISCPEITQGESYTVTAGSVSQEVAMDSLLYGSGNGMGKGSGGMGDPGGMGGKPGNWEKGEKRGKRGKRGSQENPENQEKPENQENPENQETPDKQPFV